MYCPKCLSHQVRMKVINRVKIRQGEEVVSHRCPECGYLYTKTLWK